MDEINILNNYLKNMEKNIANLFEKINYEIEDNKIIDLKSYKAKNVIGGGLIDPKTLNDKKNCSIEKNIGVGHIDPKKNYIDKIKDMRCDIVNDNIPPPIPPKTEENGGIRFIKKVKKEDVGYITPEDQKIKTKKQPPAVKKERMKRKHYNNDYSNNIVKRKDDIEKFYPSYKKYRWDFNHSQNMSVNECYSLIKEKSKERKLMKHVLKTILASREYQIIDLLQVNALQGHRMAEMMKQIEELKK